MSALTNHLREASEHSGLGFHAGCPICRCERLHGRLDDGTLLSPRTQAGLAATVLALSVVGPTSAAVAAGEPPSEREGQVAPEELGAPGDSSQTPDFDPGGPQADLEVEVGPEDPASDPDAPGPVESEPDIDPGVALEVTEPRSAPTGVPSAPLIQPTPVVAVPAPVPPAPTPPVVPPSPVPAPEAPTVELQELPASDPPAREAPSEEAPSEGHAEHRRTPKKHEASPDLATETPAAAETVTVPPTPAATPVDVVFSQVAPGDRSHVVRRGESLWSIARAIVGPDASVAEVAREVNRLWTLNRERIGTGDRDLVLTGTVLKLR